jgi:hypothetical protein
VDWADRTLPPGAVVAAKDHGRLAYFTEVQVVDLAGIIEPSVIDAYRTETMRAHLNSQGVQYVLLPETGGPAVLQVARQSLDLSLVRDAPLQEASGYRLYRVR